MDLPVTSHGSEPVRYAARSTGAGADTELATVRRAHAASVAAEKGGHLITDEPALIADDGTDDKSLVAADHPEHVTRAAGAPPHFVLDVAVDQVCFMPAEPYPRLDDNEGHFFRKYR